MAWLRLRWATLLIPLLVIGVSACGSGSPSPRAAPSPVKLYVFAGAKLMPILPLALRPNSRTELTIAFGMGSAYRASLNAGLTTTAVELVPSVPKTLGVFYPDAQQVTSDPHGHLVIAERPAGTT